eukprot:s2715_g11.t1
MLTIDDEEIRGNVEKELAEKEYALKNKKKTGPKSKAAPVEQTEKIEIDDDVWSIPSETEVKREGLDGSDITQSSMGVPVFNGAIADLNKMNPYEKKHHKDCLRVLADMLPLLHDMDPTLMDQIDAFVDKVKEAIDD